MDKRSFLKGALGIGFTSPLLKNIELWNQELEGKSIHAIAKDEEYWARIRSGYRLKSDYINLENGYYCLIPQETLEHYLSHVRRVNLEGAYYMRTVRVDNKNFMAKRLAQLIGADEDEVIITRNTTESLDTIIGGFKWEKGDEAVYAVHDYGAMKNQFNLMEARYGIKSNIVTVPLNPSSDEEVVDVYRKAITPKTRLLMVCHIINITGHILPVRKIADMAHEHGVRVMVDGAHAIGHFDFDIKDLDCDYYGSSLHKWLSVPLGSGLLYVKKGRATDIWPLFADWAGDDDIKKLNHTGTHPCATDLAVANAIDYYQAIGPKRKEARLRYLQNYWVDQVRDVPGIIINTPEDKSRSCGIANVGIEGMKPKDMAETLLKKYNIFTVAIGNRGVPGCRITPNIYTTISELDSFVEALKEMAKS